ncbi:MAG: TaqI-like C-terminal specificity domain-containing protein [Candidatus Margulisiibacteriota bacterium]
MPAPKEVIELVERFERNLEEYKSGRYNETQLRIEFLDPFFEALGWDINNKEGRAPAYRDVTHEDRLSVGEWTKSPDYCFRVGKERKFFLEAKKPSINVKEDISPAYQLRRYAWSAKLPLSILSDFEEFAVYDTRIKPVKTNGAKVARIKYFTYKDYIDKWDEIAGIFSREAVLKGSFDKYAVSGKKRRGTAEVDDEFLKEIELWREILAKNIAENNPRLSTRELNYAVQSTIDRIIFLRICEDRRIEDYARLMALQNGDNVYPRLCDLFKQADDKYNSGLFHFSEEKGRTGHPDTLALKLKIDDKPIKEIIKGLYYPDSPYQFDYMPIEILGQVYEQFLGKVIRLEDHHAVIEEKPEVRKAGGVYYTPKYIVDYIVKNTVGKLLEGKTPKQAAKIKILDPACGSGSFLIGAYQYLLDWHREWYENDGALKWAKKTSPVLYQDIHGGWQLTIAEKKRILLNNIFGVDIDSQAVEVTKLSLLLKVLEGETSQTINSTLRLFHERALPDLGNNIKCGNSLIGPDYYENKQISLLEEEERYKVNVFDWQKEFADIMQVGGFDVVIGNPPYVNMVALPKNEREYFQNKYNSCKNKSDLYSFFVEKAMCLTSKPIRRIGLIIPQTWLATDSFELLREELFGEKAIDELVDLGHGVFRGVIVKALILICSRANKEIQIKNKDFTDRISVRTNIWDKRPFQIDLSWSTQRQNISDKLYRSGKTLSSIIQFQRGIKTSNDKKFVLSKQINKDCMKVFRGRNIKAYQLNWEGEYIWYRPDLMKAKVGSLPHSKSFFEVPEKIVTQRINSSMQLLAAYDNRQNYFLDTTNVSNYSSWDKKHPLKYILALLNSKLINYWYCNKYRMPTIGLYELHSIPIKLIDKNDDLDKNACNEIIRCVDIIIKLKDQETNESTSHGKTTLSRQIDNANKHIDQLVYKLYGLTDEEVGVVEGGG